MILWKSKEILETRQGENFSCRAFRWILEVTNSSIEVVHQHEYDGKWFSSHTNAYGISRSNVWKFGTQHVYYDGPHCSFHIGKICVYWGGDPRTNWCKKCYAFDQK